MSVNLSTTFYLQVLQKRLDEVKKSTETLSERLDKAREENDDLRFQVRQIKICIAILFVRIPKKVPCYIKRITLFSINHYIIK